MVFSCTSKHSKNRNLNKCTIKGIIGVSILNKSLSIDYNIVNIQESNILRERSLLRIIIERFHYVRPRT